MGAYTWKVLASDGVPKCTVCVQIPEQFTDPYYHTIIEMAYQVLTKYEKLYGPVAAMIKDDIDPAMVQAMIENNKMKRELLKLEFGPLV